MSSAALAAVLESPVAKRRPRRFSYRVTHRAARKIYKLLNESLFENKLTQPKIRIRKMKAWDGLCEGWHEPTLHCRISVQRWLPDVQWLVVIMAHEMVHQYQWEVDGPKRLMAGKAPLLSHGPSFYAHRRRLAEHGIPLRARPDCYGWLTHRNLLKS